MDKRKTMELVILITISQNKKASANDFRHLFEREWKDYSLRFEELQPEGLFKITYPIPGIPLYELTPKGKFRITELLDEREREIEVRLEELKQIKAAAPTGWKKVVSEVNTLMHAPALSKEASNSGLKSEYMRFKAWLQSRFTKETVKG